MATQPIYIYGDTINAVLNTARSRVDDLVQTPVGSPTGSDPDLQDTQVGGMALLRELEDDGSICLRTQVITNSAWQKLQNYWANLGWRGLIQNIVVAALGANSNADVAVNSWLSWNGYFNGTTFSLTPALPALFVSPLEVRERIAGSNAQFQPMDTSLAGLRPTSTRSALNRQWEWRSNGLYLPGSSAAVDLQIRSVTLYSDFVATTGPSVPWYLQQVPVPGCRSAFAWYIAYEVCFPRGDETGAAQALLQCQDEAGKVFNQQARADQRVKQITESIPRPTPVPEEA